MGSRSVTVGEGRTAIGRWVAIHLISPLRSPLNTPLLASGLVCFECATLVRELPPPIILPMFGVSKSPPTVNASGCDIKMPGHVPLDVEKYPVAPNNLALEQVHVYVRHGMCYSSIPLTIGL